MTDATDLHNSSTGSGSTGAGHQGASHDDPGHEAAEEGEPLGPIDPLAWGAGALGVLLGLVVAACFALATAGV